MSLSTSSLNCCIQPALYFSAPITKVLKECMSRSQIDSSSQTCVRQDARKTRTHTQTHTHTNTHILKFPKHKNSPLTGRFQECSSYTKNTHIQNTHLRGSFVEKAATCLIIHVVYIYIYICLMQNILQFIHNTQPQQHKGHMH